MAIVDGLDIPSRRSYPFDKVADLDDHQHLHRLRDQHHLRSQLQQQSNNFLLHSHPHQHLMLHHLHQRQDQLLSPASLTSDGDGDQKQKQKQQLSRDMHELEDLLSKLNPLAQEFFPPSSSRSPSSDTNDYIDKVKNRKKNNGAVPGKRRISLRASKAQRDDSVRRTVYVSDIDQQVTEEQLAALFISCGQVVDCRVCGDPNSVLRFAFVEFTDEEGAQAALSLAGTMLGYYPVRVLPSKTAIVPVNPNFLPRSEDELEMCARTVYCANIDKKVSQSEVKAFFETLCGEVARLRLLGDYHHATRIAFVEFVMAESAMAALNCSGAILGSLPIRVSPSKTPVRPRSPRLL